LAPWASGFEGWLAARGFSRSAAFHRMCLLAALSRWLEAEGLGAGELIAERAGLFVAARRRVGLRSWVSPRCVALPLEYLREVGVAPPPVAVVADGPVEVLLEGYREYLLVEVAWRARRSFVTSASRGCFSSSGRSGLSLSG
jgi:hypothetical protein